MKCQIEMKAVYPTLEKHKTCTVTDIIMTVNNNLDIRVIPHWFSAITAVMLQDSKLTKVPRNLTQLFPNMQILIMKCVKIKSLERSDFEDMDKLTQLQVIYCDELETLASDLLFDLKHLQVVNFYKNKIKSISRDFFKEHKNLKYINFNGNPGVKGCVNKIKGPENVTQVELNEKLSNLYIVNVKKVQENENKEKRLMNIQNFMSEKRKRSDDDEGSTKKLKPNESESNETQQDISKVVNEPQNIAESSKKQVKNSLVIKLNSHQQILQNLASKIIKKSKHFQKNLNLNSPQKTTENRDENTNSIQNFTELPENLIENSQNHQNIPVDTQNDQNCNNYYDEISDDELVSECIEEKDEIVPQDIREMAKNKNDDVVTPNSCENIQSMDENSQIISKTRDSSDNSQFQKNSNENSSETSSFQQESDELRTKFPNLIKVLQFGNKMHQEPSKEQQTNDLNVKRQENVNKMTTNNKKNADKLPKIQSTQNITKINPNPISHCSKSTQTSSESQLTQRHSSQTFPTSSINNIMTLLKQRKFTDFVIIIDNCEFHIHKLVLAAKSKKFAKFLAKHEHISDIVIFGTPVDIFKIIVDFIYDDKLPVIENDENLNFQKIFIAAKKFELEKLKNHAVNELIKSINANNAFELLTFSNENDCDALRTAAFNEIKKLFPNKNIKDELARECDKLKKLIAMSRRRESIMKELDDKLESVWKEIEN